MMNGCSSWRYLIFWYLGNALLDQDVSAAYIIWSSSAEDAFADAFGLAGGPLFAKGRAGAAHCSVGGGHLFEGPGVVRAI